MDIIRNGLKVLIENRIKSDVLNLNNIAYFGNEEEELTNIIKILKEKYKDELEISSATYLTSLRQFRIDSNELEDETQIRVRVYSTSPLDLLCPFDPTMKGISFRQEISKYIGIYSLRLVVAVGMNILEDNYTLQYQKVSHRSLILVIVASDVNSTWADSSKNTFDTLSLFNCWKDAELVRDQYSSKKVAETVKKYTVGKLSFSESDGRTLCVAIDLYRKAQKAMQQSIFPVAILCILRMKYILRLFKGDPLKYIENYAFMNVALAWCYLQIQCFTHLVNPLQLLKESENNIKLIYGESFQLLTSTHTGRTVILRLHITKAVAYFHCDQIENARDEIKYAKKLLDDYKQIKLDTEMVERGILKCETERWETKSSEIYEPTIDPDDPDLGKAMMDNVTMIHGYCANGKLVNIMILTKMVEEGYNRCLSAQGLRVHNNDMYETILWIENFEKTIKEICGFWINIEQFLQCSMVEVIVGPLMKKHDYNFDMVVYEILQAYQDKIKHPEKDISCYSIDIAKPKPKVTDYKPLDPSLPGTSTGIFPNIPHNLQVLGPEISSARVPAVTKSKELDPSLPGTSTRIFPNIPHNLQVLGTEISLARVPTVTNSMPLDPSLPGTRTGIFPNIPHNLQVLGPEISSARVPAVTNSKELDPSLPGTSTGISYNINHHFQVRGAEKNSGKAPTVTESKEMDPSLPGTSTGISYNINHHFQVRGAEKNSGKAPTVTESKEMDPSLPGTSTGISYNINHHFQVRGAGKNSGKAPTVTESKEMDPSLPGTSTGISYNINHHFQVRGAGKNSGKAPTVTKSKEMDPSLPGTSTGISYNINHHFQVRGAGKNSGKAPTVTNSKELDPSLSGTSTEISHNIPHNFQVHGPDKSSAKVPTVTNSKPLDPSLTATSTGISHSTPQYYRVSVKNDSTASKSDNKPKVQAGKRSLVTDFQKRNSLIKRKSRYVKINTKSGAEDIRLPPDISLIQCLPKPQPSIISTQGQVGRTTSLTVEETRRFQGQPLVITGVQSNVMITDGEESLHAENPFEEGTSLARDEPVVEMDFTNDVSISRGFFNTLESVDDDLDQDFRLQLGLYLDAQYQGGKNFDINACDRNLYQNILNITPERESVLPVPTGHNDFTHTEQEAVTWAPITGENVKNITSEYESVPCSFIGTSYKDNEDTAHELEPIPAWATISYENVNSTTSEQESVPCNDNENDNSEFESAVWASLGSENANDVSSEDESLPLVPTASNEIIEATPTSSKEYNDPDFSYFPDFDSESDNHNGRPLEQIWQERSPATHFLDELNAMAAIEQTKESRFRSLSEPGHAYYPHVPRQTFTTQAATPSDNTIGVDIGDKKDALALPKFKKPKEHKECKEPEVVDQLPFRLLTLIPRRYYNDPTQIEKNQPHAAPMDNSFPLEESYILLYAIILRVNL